MDKVVDTLRLTDTRFGYNGKRGNAADPSLDVIAYNWGSQPDEGTTEVYIFDILLGHCGNSPARGGATSPALAVRSAAGPAGAGSPDRSDFSNAYCRALSIAGFPIARKS